MEDLLGRMTLEEKIGQMNMPCAYKQRIGWGINPNDGNPSIHRQMSAEERAKQMDGCRKFARGDHNSFIGQGGGFFTLADRIIYEGTLKQAEFFNELQNVATKESRLGIPLITDRGRNPWNDVRRRNNFPGRIGNWRYMEQGSCEENLHCRC